MGQQEYDFFATGAARPSSPLEPGIAEASPPLAEPGSDVRFVPVDPRPAPEPLAPPVAPSTAAPAVAPAASGRLFDGPDGQIVNQFGTPVGVAALPTGPSAAPGYAPEPWNGYGLAGNDPALARLPKVLPTPASAPPTRSGKAQAGMIIAAIQGVLGALASLVTFIGLLALESAFSTSGVFAVSLPGWVKPVTLLALALYVTVAGVAIAALAGRATAIPAIGYLEMALMALAVLRTVLGVTDASVSYSLGTMIGGLLVPVLVIALLSGLRAPVGARTS